ncbi:unnamed protein product [Mytilus coruscus]|uniref:Uncharacterized protein n=1 Tax=Mytilus coruscus TaxID=42192 RepID=A0A6J8CJE1_MYTCO|nr:unnamed protein product [Mytilus coruscus]
MSFREYYWEDAAQILELAAAPVNGDNLKKLLHVTVILANEIGQPAGEDLRHVENEHSGDEDPPPKKKKKNHDLLQRVADLEKSKEDNVKELKYKVRSLALQANPSEPLILLSLDELAKKARRQNDDDAETFDELARQAQRHQGSINVATLTLNVLGGKASDLVGKAMAKCFKEKEVEQKITGNKANHMEKMETTSPLANAYPPATCMPNYFMPHMPTGWQQGMFPFSTSMYHNQGPRRFSRRNGQWRPRGNCFFCNSNDHVVKDLRR